MGKKTLEEILDSIDHECDLLNKKSRAQRLKNAKQFRRTLIVILLALAMFTAYVMAVIHFV